MNQVSLPKLQAVVPLRADVQIEGVTLELVSLEAWTGLMIIRCAKAASGEHEADFAEAQRIASVQNHRVLDRVVLGEGARPQADDRSVGGCSVGIGGGDLLEVTLHFAWQGTDLDDLWLGYRDDPARRWQLSERLRS